MSLKDIIYSHRSYFQGKEYALCFIITSPFLDVIFAMLNILYHAKVDFDNTDTNILRVIANHC